MQVTSPVGAAAGIGGVSGGGETERQSKYDYFFHACVFSFKLNVYMFILLN